MGCEPLMNNYGFRWPDSLGCTRLPAKDCLSSDSTDNIYSHNENNNTHFYGNKVYILLKIDKGQQFNFVCRRSCVSDNKNFMIDM